MNLRQLQWRSSHRGRGADRDYRNAIRSDQGVEIPTRPLDNCLNGSVGGSPQGAEFLVAAALAERAAVDGRSLFPSEISARPRKRTRRWAGEPRLSDRPRPSQEVSGVADGRTSLKRKRPGGRHPFCLAPAGSPERGPGDGWGSLVERSAVADRVNGSSRPTADLWRSRLRTTLRLCLRTPLPAGFLQPRYRWIGHIEDDHVGSCSEVGREIASKHGLQFDR